MNVTNDQINFNFSRKLDIQKNLSLEKADNLYEKIFNHNYKNIFLQKHLKLLILELFYCWHESEDQFLTLSMSKRGYNSKSRYNPNNISSYTIKAINFLRDEKLIDFHPGFFDRKKNISRLTRIRASKNLVNLFSHSLLLLDKKINHPKREFLILKDKNNLPIEYSDNFLTHEIRELLIAYNNLLSKSLLDIPTYEDNILVRFDKKKIVISDTNSQANLFCLSSSSNILEFSGYWWDKLDINLLLRFQDKFLINNQLTSYIDLNDFFKNFISQKLSLKKELIDRSLISDDFNFSQKCKIVLKGINLKNFESLIRSISLEKKDYFVNEKINISEIRDKIYVFMKKNDKISDFFFKGNQINWKAKISEIFLGLIKKIIPANIPIYLVQEKIYFPYTFKETVLERLNEILEKDLKVEKQQMKCYNCDEYNLRPKSFFSRIVTSKNGFSKRYMNRLSNLRLK